MKIAICTEDAACRAHLLAFAEEYSSRHTDLNITVTAYAHAEDLLESVTRYGDFEICLLDILLSGINGIDLGVRLRQTGCGGKIIFISGSAEHALESFRAHPFHYLLKPVSREMFLDTLHEAVESLPQNSESSIIVKTKEGSIKLSLSSILYAQLYKRVIVYHLIGGRTVESIQIRTNFAEAVQDLLNDGRFVLGGASIAANLHHITLIEKDALHFRDACKVYLPRKASVDVRNAWIRYFGEPRE